MSATKAILIATIASTIFLAGEGRADAIPIFFSWGGEKIIKVANFPDTEGFKTLEGKHLDAGYRYKQISLFFIPVWNYDGKWCGYIGESDHYLDISKTDLADLASINLPDSPSLPFWDSYGGKLLLLGILLVFGMAKKTQVSIPDDKSQPTLPQ